MATTHTGHSDNSVVFNLRSLLEDEEARLHARAEAEQNAARERTALLEKQRAEQERLQAERAAESRAREEALAQQAQAREEARLEQQRVDALKVQLDSLARERAASEARTAEHALALARLSAERDAKKRSGRGAVWAALAMLGLGAAGVGVMVRQSAMHTAPAAVQSGTSDAELAALRQRTQRSLDELARLNAAAAAPAVVAAPVAVVPAAVTVRPGPRPVVNRVVQARTNERDPLAGFDVNDDPIASVGLEGGGRVARRPRQH